MNALIGKQKFLIAEDNPAMSALLRQLLIAIGARQVRAAANGKAAQEAILAECPDIVITDLAKASVSGTELVAWIRNDPQSPSPDLAVIVMSAHSEPARIIAARDAGVDEYLVKPFDTNRLKQRILAVIARRKAEPRTPPRASAAPAPKDGEEDAFEIAI